MIQISTPFLAESQTPLFQPKPEIRAEQARRRRWLREFKQARVEDRIAMVFRPRISLQTGELIGAESRLRWAPRRQSMMQSNALYQFAEQAGDAASLGGWSLQAACQAAMSWSSEAMLVSVRIPPALQHPSLLNLHLAEALEVSGLPPERLELRFAEPDLADLGADGLLWLCAIRDLGVSVALEHFGTGATSLAMLRRLPLSTLTISFSLFSHLPEDREDAAILRAILTVARALELETVADGVQTHAQAKELTEAGCDAVQGRLIGSDRPSEYMMGFGGDWMNKA